MGAPKQKWTAEEEAALKAGVGKHGAGKWRTILTDPEFSAILRIRSNVDLKDKWRNINVTAIWGSRQKAKLALKRCLPAPKIGNNQLALTTAQRDEEVLDTKPLAVSGGTMQSPRLKEQTSRMNKYILEAIINMKELNGSDKASIASYIAEKYHSPSNFRKLLSSRLKHMVATGKIIKEKHKYRVAPSSTISGKRRSSSALRREERAKDSLETEKSDDVNIISKPQDAQPSKAKGMTAQEAATAAAQAIAEAEIAAAEAEKAAKVAAAAEAEAEAAELFALGVMRALRNNMLHLW